jgi:N-acetyl-anhydromuramyl-L-alanine amidase AmpD
MKVIDIRQIIPKHKTRIVQTRSKHPSHIVVHCTDSENQDPIKTAKYHVTPNKDNRVSKLGAPTIAYSDFINKEGIVYHCVDYDKITFHAQLYNSCSIGIVLAYKENKGPTSVQYDSLIKHLTVLSLYLKIKPKNI